MTTQEIQEAVKQVMAKDPIEIAIDYYKGLIQLHADQIADHQHEIHLLQKRMAELQPAQSQEGDTT